MATTQMNIKPKIHVDKAADVLYVNFGSEEPTWIDTSDDMLLVEIGIYSRMPVGFRVVNFKKHGVKKVEIEVIVKKLAKKLNASEKQMAQKGEELKEVIERELQAA